MGKQKIMSVTFYPEEQQVLESVRRKLNLGGDRYVATANRFIIREYAKQNGLGHLLVDTAESGKAAAK